MAARTDRGTHFAGPLWVGTTGAGNPAVVLDVKAYGAVGNGTTDDTAAIQAAIEDAEATGRTVYLPNGNYLLSGSGSELLLLSEGVSIIGESWAGSKLVIAASVSSTTDVIRLHPAAGVAFQNFTLSNFFIVPINYPATPARHGIVVDTTDAAIAYGTFSNIYIYPLGGRAFYTINPTLSDGFYTSTIENCLLYGGCRLQRAGDSIVFRGNTITGDNIGIEADFVSGATSFEIAENNITSKSSAIKIGLAATVVIRDNNMESTAGGSYPGVPVIDLSGDAASRHTPHVVGNSISALVDDGNAINLDYVDRAYIGPNSISVDGTGVGIAVSSHALYPTVDLEGIKWSGTSTTKLTDASQTTGIPQTARRTPLTYSASITPDALTGRTQSLTATDGNAFTINAPTNAYLGLRLAFIIRNPTGAPLGVATWNAVFKMTAWVQPATGFSRTIEFEYNGTNWIEQSRTAADVAL